MPDNNTCTNTATEVSQSVDIDEIVKLRRNFQMKFIQSFTGIPVKVDKSLKGNSHYIAISQELLRELEDNNIEYKNP